MGSTGARRISVMFVDNDRLEHQRVAELATSFDWEMLFASTAAEALTTLERNGHCDVVITTLSLPDMSGAQLLSRVRDLHPHVLRFVTSNFQDVNHSADSISVAHQFLPAPLNSAQLAKLAERTSSLLGDLSDPGLRAMLADVDVLPSPPVTVLELNYALSRSEVSVREVAAIVENDPAMTAKLVQLVNSAFFGLRHRITDVEHAVSYLGINTVRNLLCAVELVRAFNSPNPEIAKAMEEVHRHSIAVAELARNLMVHRSQMHDAFAAGMLHDIGLLALISKMPDRYLALREEAALTGRPLVEIEREELGAGHDQLGAYLLGLWGLPPTLVNAVAHSHDAYLLPERMLNPTHAVFVAEQITNVLGDAELALEGGSLPDFGYLSDLGLEQLVEDLVIRRS